MAYQLGSFNDIWTMFMAVYFNRMFLSAVDFLLRLWHGARKLILKGAGEQAGDRTEKNP